MPVSGFEPRPSSTSHMLETLSEPTRVECRRVALQLWDYLDDYLTSEATASLRAHLAECRECRGYQQFQTRYLDAMASVRGRTRTPRHLKRRVLEVLADEGFAPR